MAKWADYLISAVRYNHDKSYISNLNVHVDNGDSVGNPTDFSKNEVVNKINSGKIFVTIINNNEGKWSKGTEVKVYHKNGNSYLRTDSNSTEKDNLGELPIF